MRERKERKERKEANGTIASQFRKIAVLCLNLVIPTSNLVVKLKRDLGNEIVEMLATIFLTGDITNFNSP